MKDYTALSDICDFIMQDGKILKNRHGDRYSDLLSSDLVMMIHDKRITILVKRHRLDIVEDIVFDFIESCGDSVIRLEVIPEGRHYGNPMLSNISSALHHGVPKFSYVPLIYLADTFIFNKNIIKDSKDTIELKVETKETTTDILDIISVSSKKYLDKSTQGTNIRKYIRISIMRGFRSILTIGEV